MSSCVFRGHNPMPKECANCPFKMEREGKPYLRPQRMADIKFAVALGQPFYCHKTVYQKSVEQDVDPETGEERPPIFDKRFRVCRGAINYAEQHADEDVVSVPQLDQQR